ncbi:zinc/cadmium resistance protein [Parambassis ranga]|uniref:Zinc/cadmium resistance protein n=1 Tax=Parambassis ranga TaxID=210632 RepID=A0A6P7JG30_9TELE|nr:zinc/cadmium resistance protein-like [Parambassis ranga]
MRLLNWCMLGATTLLLMCEVAISQLCKSLITLVDGFHTLFILMHMALPLPQSESMLRPLLSSAPPLHSSFSLAAPPPTQPAEISTRPPLSNQTKSSDGSVTDQLNNHEADSEFNSIQICSAKFTPAASNCGLSYPTSRIQVVGVFIPTLLLASLCVAHVIEIISFCLEPHPVQRPLLLVVVGGVSVLLKMLLFGLNLDQLQEERGTVGRQPDAGAHLQVNPKALSEEESISLEESKNTSQSNVLSKVDDSMHSGVLVLCNPGTSSLPDADSKAPQSDIHLHDREVKSKDIREPETTRGVCTSSPLSERPLPDSQWPVFLQSFISVIWGLFTSLLALINSLVMLFIAPQFVHSSGSLSLLVYLDPCLSLLAVITLLAATLPQVYRYGWVLLQATPPHMCVSDLRRRIASVPGVQAVHDLHVWQLTESHMVASVHVHCFAGLPPHRCADLMSGVTKVLQSVGVTSSTVQPEFAPSCGSSADNKGNGSSMVQREDPSPPPLLACSLACGKACAGHMCCSLLEEETGNLLAPPAGETKEEPQTLVIENTFL